MVWLYWSEKMREVAQNDRNTWIKIAGLAVLISVEFWHYFSARRKPSTLVEWLPIIIFVVAIIAIASTEFMAKRDIKHEEVKLSTKRESDRYDREILMALLWDLQRSSKVMVFLENQDMKKPFSVKFLG